MLFFLIRVIAWRKMLWKGGRKVDKSHKEKRVTIKINGEEKSYVQNHALSTEERQDEAATRESADESFDWMLPNEIMLSPEPTKGKLYKKQSRQIKLKTPFILAVVAIIFGTGLGLLVIRMITSEQTVTQPVEKDTPAVAPVTEGSIETLTIPTFFVQGGVFSTEEAAKAVQAEIHSKNLPAEVFQIEKSYYVFLGVAENLEASKELALNYKTNEIAVFWKEIDFKTKLAKNDQEVEKALSIYSSLAELSSAKLLHVDSSADVNKVSEQLKDLQLSKHQEIKGKLLEAVELLQNDKPNKAQEKLLTFLQSIAQ